MNHDIHILSIFCKHDIPHTPSKLLTFSPAFLDLLGRLRRDVNGADGLAVGVEGRAGVLSLVAGSDGLDQQRNRAGHVVVQHLVFVGPCSNKSSYNNNKRCLQNKMQEETNRG